MIHYPALGLVKGVVENISLDGVFVKTESVNLSVDSELQLSVKLEYNGELVTHKLHGTIVHDYAQGFGIAFNKLKMEAESRLSLRVLLHG
ncbi:MAG: PilZ domain-containing protein [Methylococcales bacterium]|jgi:hypothetical protein|nr:PilZ domain-containing protein [Methylococcales bacterium]MBT7443576.1 PilZ domain-containing protein [Methylococcales bacterium]